MERTNVLIVGAGAAGLFLAARLGEEKKVLLLERGERAGRKLSATGNGQGNVTNERMDESKYFTSESKERGKISRVLEEFGKSETLSFLEELGGLFAADERGRVYPTGRQASAVTDLLRKRLQRTGAEIRLGHMVENIRKKGNGFVVTASFEGEKREFYADNVVLCAGGKAAKNFGSDGNGYSLAGEFSHTVTSLYPSLVQLKTDTMYIKPLKGIRVNGASVEARSNGQKIAEERGDVIFTDYGVSGDAIFRVSAFVVDRLKDGVELSIDFLPEQSEEKLIAAIERKRKTEREEGEILCGILNNQAGRCVMKRAKAEGKGIVETMKNFTLNVCGSLGFDYAQVTKGGVPLSETDENLQSKFCKGLYFAGEILDVDGECGGYNLQWAFSSAAVVAKAIVKEND